MSHSLSDLSIPTAPFLDGVCELFVAVAFLLELFNCLEIPGEDVRERGGGEKMRERGGGGVHHVYVSAEMRRS
jgi:hypothetical protein